MSQHWNCNIDKTPRIHQEIACNKYLRKWQLKMVHFVCLDGSWTKGSKEPFVTLSFELNFLIAV